jgi:hypothetical protein
VIAALHRDRSGLRARVSSVRQAGRRHGPTPPAGCLPPDARDSDAGLRTGTRNSRDSDTGSAGASVPKTSRVLLLHLSHILGREVEGAEELPKRQRVGAAGASPPEAERDAPAHLRERPEELPAYPSTEASYPFDALFLSSSPDSSCSIYMSCSDLYVLSPRMRASAGGLGIRRYPTQHLLCAGVQVASPPVIRAGIAR